MTILQKGCKRFLLVLFILLITVPILLGTICNLSHKSYLAALAAAALLLGVVICFKKPLAALQLKLNKIKPIYICLGLSALCLVLNAAFAFYFRPLQAADYRTFFQVARDLSNGNHPGMKDYVAMFPHILGYAAFLSVFLRIFGQSLVVAVAVNIFLITISGALLFYLAREMTNTFSSACVFFLWAVCPSKMFYNTMSLSEPYYTCLLLLFFFLFSRTVKRVGEEKTVWLPIALIALLCGGLLALVQSARPIAVIPVIAVIIWLLFLHDKNQIKRTWKVWILFIGVMILSFVGGEKAWKAYATEQLEQVPPSVPGYNIYVGFNPDTNGSYSDDDMTMFQNLYFGECERNAVAAQQLMLEAAKERVHSAGGGLPRLMLYKLKTLLSHDEGGAYYAMDSLTQRQYSLSCLISNVWYYLVCVMAMFGAVLLWSEQDRGVSMIVVLFTIGLILAQMLVEVAARYHYAVIPMLLMIAAVFVKKVQKQPHPAVRNRQEGEAMPRKREGWVFLLGAGLFFLSVTWMNFHCAQWFNFDMFADASFARLASEQHTLFPEGWLFGNQYYVIATPAVAALFYQLCHNSILAISLATTLMYATILLCFFWCSRALFSQKAQWIGLFCMAGATVLGDSVSSSTYGFQILYSMASYYACYVLVILLHLGIWARILKKNRVHSAAVLTALVTSFTLGIQSPRETLSLCIPLLVIALILLLLKNGAAKSSFFFAIASFGANLLGLLLNSIVKQTLGRHYASNISEVSVNLKPSVVAANFLDTARAFLDLVGLRYWSYSWKWKPLAVLGAVLLVLCVLTLAKWLKSHNNDCRAAPMLFCWVSILCIFAAGIFLIRTRAIYFFVWYLLVPFSVAYLTDLLPEKRNKLFCVGILFIGVINAFFNFYPDISRYSEQKHFYSEIVSWLEEQKIDRIYGDYQAPTIAAASNDAIAYTSIFPNLKAVEKESEGLILPSGSPVEVTGYQSVDPEHAVLILSDSPYDEASGFRYLQENATDSYKEHFAAVFKPVTSFESPYVSYHIYSFSEANLFPAGSIP